MITVTRDLQITKHNIKMIGCKDNKGFIELVTLNYCTVASIRMDENSGGGT